MRVARTLELSDKRPGFWLGRLRSCVPVYFSRKSAAFKV
jgi:hypothetical protein